MNGRTGSARVVVTRSAAQSESLRAALEELGVEVIGLALLEIVDLPEGIARLDDVVRSATDDDWLVVLSPNGARRARVATDFPGTVAAIGDSTAAALASVGVSVGFVSPTATSEAMLDALGDETIRGAVIVVQAEQGRSELADGLRALGHTVEVVTVYRNDAPDLGDAACQQAANADLVTFASPSAVVRYVDAVGVRPRSAVCIGPVTGDAAREAGFDVTIASEPSIEALVAAVAESIGADLASDAG